MRRARMLFKFAFFTVKQTRKLEMLLKNENAIIYEQEGRSEAQLQLHAPLTARERRCALLLAPSTRWTRLPGNSLDAQIDFFDGDLDRRNTTQTDPRHRHSDADGVGHRDRRLGERRPP